MQHNGFNTMAQFSRNLREAGLAIRMTEKGVMIGKQYALGIFAVKETFNTLHEAYLWSKTI